MALPTSASTSWVPQRAGVRAMVFSTDPSLGFQVELSSANTTSSSKWMIRRFLPSAVAKLGGTVTWEVPLSTQAWFMRAKAWKLGQTNSAYSTVVSLTPHALNAILPAPSVEARRIAQFGNFTTANSRTLRFPAPLGVLALSSQHGKIGVNYFKPNTTNLSQTWYIPLALPKGVTITNIKWGFLKKTSANSDAQLTVSLLFGTTGATAIATVVPSASSVFQTFNSGAISNLVPTSDTVVAKVVIKTSSVTTGKGAEHRWLDITYTQPQLAIGY